MKKRRQLKAKAKATATDKFAAAASAARAADLDVAKLLADPLDDESRSALRALAQSGSCSPLRTRGAWRQQARPTAGDHLVRMCRTAFKDIEFSKVSKRGAKATFDFLFGRIAESNRSQ